MGSLSERLVAALREAGEEAKVEGQRFADHPWDTTTNVVGRNLAALAGLPVDTVHNVVNLGRAGYGLAKHAITGKAEDLVDLNDTEQTGGSEHIGRLMTEAGLMTGERNPLLELAGGIVGPVAGAGMARGAAGAAGRAGARAGQAQAAARAQAEAFAKAREVPEIQGPPTLRQTIEANARQRDPQTNLPGMEPTLEERSDAASRRVNEVQEQGMRERGPHRLLGELYPTGQRELEGMGTTPDQRVRSASQRNAATRVTSPETAEALEAAKQAEAGAMYDESRGIVADLKAQRRPDESIDDAMPREEEILSGKRVLAELAPAQEPRLPDEAFGNAISAPDAQQTLINRLLDARRDQARIEEERDYRPTPDWVRNLTTDPTSHPDMPRGVPEPLETGRNSPAGDRWWEQKFPPITTEDKLAAFLREAQSNPDIHTYGPDPGPEVQSLEDWGNYISQRSKHDIKVRGGRERDITPDHDDYDPDIDDEYIERKREYERGEPMKDEHGNWKYDLDNPKTHQEGDSPMYDEEGEVKIGKTGEEDLAGPVLAKRVAEGGELKRDEYGNPVYPKLEAEGGEKWRDWRGRTEYEEVRNPDYRPRRVSDSDEVTMHHGPGSMTISDINSGNPTVDAQAAKGQGAPMYQALYGWAARNGVEIGSNSLSDDNAMRLLSNALSSAARTGVNVRNVRNTASGNRPRATGVAEPHELWRAETGEAEERLRDQGATPEHLTFTPEGFRHMGQPITADEIKARTAELSPKFADVRDDTGRRTVVGTKVGPKTLMRGAVYRWLEDHSVSPEEAAEAAKNWGKHGAPLFSVGGATLLASQLRDDGKKTD